MSEKEREEFHKAVKAESRKVKDKKAAQDFLVRLGVFKRNGALAKEYK